MVPDKFNMVDMGGIDLIMMQGEEVPGLYNRLVESITQCRYQCLYNWLFDGVIIPPTYVELEVNDEEEVAINEGVTVSSDDVIHIYSLEPAPVDPEIIPLLVEENGVYNVPTGVDGFNPVTVDVPSYTPVIEPISIAENGTYTAPTGTDGYSPITVNVSDGNSFINPDYQGFSYGYLARDGSSFYSGPNNTNYLQIYPVVANHKYAFFVGETVGSRRRAGFFQGKTITDFLPYIESPGAEVVVFSSGIWLAPFTQGTDDTGDALAGRIIYTPTSDGVVVYGTNNTGTAVKAYCVEFPN